MLDFGNWILDFRTSKFNFRILKLTFIWFLDFVTATATASKAKQEAGSSWFFFFNPLYEKL